MKLIPLLAVVAACGSNPAAPAPAPVSNVAADSATPAIDPCAVRDDAQRRLDECLDMAPDAQDSGAALREFARRQSALKRHRVARAAAVPAETIAEPPSCELQAARLAEELAVVDCEPPP